MSPRSQPVLWLVFLLLVGVAIIPMLPFTGVRNPSQLLALAKFQKSQAQRKALVGNWYMGTMSGFDCNLKIDSSNVLTVQFGGCFQQDKPIKTFWWFQGDKIMFQSSTLNGSLGKYMRVTRYKNHFVLFSEKSKAIVGTRNYSYTRCFWRNIMKNGLQLSKDAPQ